jgi:hypothetical protein
MSKKIILSFIPTHMRLLFADLVVLRSENIDLFYLQLWEFVQCVKPEDFVEWVWVRDVAVLNWEIRRWQQFKVFFVGFGHEEIERHLKELGTFFRNPEAN